MKISLQKEHAQFRKIYEIVQKKERKSVQNADVNAFCIPIRPDTDKHCLDGTAGMDPKVRRSIPLQQEEKTLKRSGFICTSADVFVPDKKKLMSEWSNNL